MNGVAGVAFDRVKGIGVGIVAGHNAYMVNFAAVPVEQHHAARFGSVAAVVDAPGSLALGPGLQARAVVGVLAVAEVHHSVLVEHAAGEGRAPGSSRAVQRPAGIVLIDQSVDSFGIAGLGHAFHG